MLKDITIGQYFPGASVLHKLDPRVKIVLTIAYIITSALGMNVGGIPLEHHPFGFWIVCIVALAVTLVAGIIIGRNKNFR